MHHLQGQFSVAMSAPKVSITSVLLHSRVALTLNQLGDFEVSNLLLSDIQVDEGRKFDGKTKRTGYIFNNQALPLWATV